MMTATVVRRSYTGYQVNRNAQQTHMGKRKADEHRSQPYTARMINRIIAAVQAGHKLYVLRYHDASDHVRSMIYADYTTEQVYVENFPDGFAVSAFGAKRHISWRDYQLFMIERCAKEDAPMDEYIRLNVLGKTSMIPAVGTYIPNYFIGTFDFSEALFYNEIKGGRMT